MQTDFKNTENITKRKIVILSIILIVVIGFLVYSNSLNNPFIWDDKTLVVDNIYIKNPSKINKIFTQDTGAGGGAAYHFYRPLQMLTYMLDYSIWKLNAGGYRFTNIFLHLLVASSLYWLMSIIYKNYLFSFFVSLLFVIHPIHTEAVTYISGRADPLAICLMLLSFILYIKSLSLKNISISICVYLCYLLAILSKEYSLILPVLLMLYHYVFQEKIRVRKFLPILIITFLYISFRLTFLKQIAPQASLITTTIFDRIPGFFVAVFTYIKLLLLPCDLHMEYGLKSFSILDFKVISGLIISLSLLFVAFIKRRENSLITFSILWFFVALLPQSNIYAINAYMAEHWLYLPSIGFFVLLSNGLFQLYNSKKLSYVAVIAFFSLALFYSWLTIKQNSYWKAPIAFYERILKYTPQSYRVYLNLGNSYQDKEQYEKAINAYKKAIEINPNNADPYLNLALIYQDTGFFNEAIALYNKIILINPGYDKAYNNLGNVYKDIGKIEASIAMYKKAIAINPERVEAYYNLGFVLYMSLGKKEEAIVLFKKAIEIDPRFSDAYNNLAVAYYYKEQYDLAIKYCNMAIRLGYKVDPNFLKLLEPFKNTVIE